MDQPIARRQPPVRALLKTDGTRVDYSEPLTLNEIRKLIGADTLDTVNLWHLGRNDEGGPLYAMFVNDNGWETESAETQLADGSLHIEVKATRPRLPINAEATELYLKNCRPGTTHQIAGDAFVVPDADFA